MTAAVADDRIRITVQLINAADGYTLWSERYDREVHDVFDIQEDIARTIVETLRVKLDGCLTGAMLAKDRAAEAVSRVMIPEALDYPQ